MSASCQECSLSSAWGWGRYDEGLATYASSLAFDCGDMPPQAYGTNAQFGSVVYPPTLPWEITGACALLGTPGSVPVRREVQAAVYDVKVDPGVGYWRPKLPIFTSGNATFTVWPLSAIPNTSAAAAFQAIPFSFGKRERFISPTVHPIVDHSNHTVAVTFEPRVFVGVSFHGCGDMRVLGSTTDGTSGPQWTRMYTYSFLYTGPGSTADLKSLSLRVSGKPASVTPDVLVQQGWTCNSSFYGDGAQCHCGCGLVDPDCAAVGAAGSKVLPAECPVGKVCVDGTCQAHLWNTSRPLCADPARAVSDGVCQCGCGTTTSSLVDPDCRDPAKPLAPGSCPGLVVPYCHVEMGDPALCKDRYTCAASTYNDGEVCDCGCSVAGVAEPDCLSGALLTRCHASSICIATTPTAGLSCLSGVCVPSAWRCPTSRFGDRISCDCDCGAYDPDCYATPALPLTGCLETDPVSECSSDGTCLKVGCGNRHPDRALNETCDSGLGCSPVNCTCEEGYRPRQPLSMDCSPICMDNLLVPFEPCDPSFKADRNCDNVTCTCKTSALGGGVCSDWCGNLFVDSVEECDGTAWCYPMNCTCAADHRPMPDGRCIGCGDNFTDYGEDCDGGDKCVNCTCAPGTSPTKPASASCQADTSSPSAVVSSVLRVVPSALSVVLTLALACRLTS